MLSIELTSIATLAVLLVLLFVLLVRQKAVQATIQDKLSVQESLITQQSQTIAAQEISLRQLAELEAEHFSENSQVTKQLEHRIATLKQQLTELESLCQSLNQQSTEDKFYSRALKLAQKGADVDEIVAECEIPRAEAEMLLAVHQKKS
ncbi:DUF2802 domain-containing protein [Thalassotalea sp. LPB0316]|uniref:DUF2802 domain-containing protein n=1 Tax=Thalassotalea sp. LPB0316 TaxID=2769490 RepID=UPI001868835D|nr:DUF2802 domain-containing protein [Thalassotalea sp. LPB0316]QOL27115.1 DUF2802 domain-containing protein [Thalassotalea sp. LPB0316]